jgi:DNA repair and recombination protein RAD52
MFNEKQLQVLKYELDSSRIKSRSKGNVNLSYLEGFDIIDTANLIFGYGNWNYAISKLEQVSQETNQNQNVVVCYKAVIEITVHDMQHTKQISREDVGFGTGISKTLADAHENGAKEAVTDALKRAMRSFGNQFGNSLYDKSRQHQNRQQTNQQSTSPQNRPIQNAIPQDYRSLYNLGLSVTEQGEKLVVIGEDIFAKKDSIKACGFRWDRGLKLWYKLIEQAA